MNNSSALKDHTSRNEKATSNYFALNLGNLTGTTQHDGLKARRTSFLGSYNTDGLTCHKRNHIHGPYREH